MLPAWLLQIRGRVPRAAGIALGLVPILLLVALWWFCTRGEPEERIISVTILPSPSEVLGSVDELVRNRNLAHHAWVSFQRVGLGYLLAVAICLPLGILMGSFGAFRSLFTPITTASGYIPIATLVPLTMSWFGTDDKQKIIFLAMAFGIYLLPMIVSAIEGVSDVYLRTAYTLGAGRLQTIFRVLIPIALPTIWQGMRLAFGVGWTYLVLTEVVIMDDGLGALVAISQRRGPREHIYLVIVVITIIAWIADLLWDRLGQLLFPYRRSRA